MTDLVPNEAQRANEDRKLQDMIESMNWYQYKFTETQDRFYYEMANAKMEMINELLERDKDK